MRRILHTAARYALAVVVTAVALLLTLRLHAWVGPLVFLFFYPALGVSAMLAGLGPGLVTIALSLLAVSWWFYSPGTLGVSGPEAVRMLVFAVVGTGFTGLAELLRRARMAAEAHAAESARLAELAETASLQAEEEAARAEEETLRADEERARTVAILEGMTDGFMAFDRSWRITYFNQEAARVLPATGVDVGDLAGKVLWEVWPHLVGTRLEREYRRAMDEQVPTHLEHYSEGRHTWLELHLHPSPEGLGLFFRDIGERKQAEESLQESEARLRLALEAGNCGTWDWDIRENRVTWSERVYQLHGIAPGRFGGRVQDFSALVHPEDRARVTATIRRSLEGGEDYQVDFRIVRPDGAIRWLTTGGRVFFDESRQPVRMLGVTTDVTERRRVEEQLRVVQQLEVVGRLAGGVAHEVNNQMSVVLGCADFVLRRTDLPDPVRTDVEHMRSAAQRSATVTGQLLAFSRRQILRLEALDLNLVVRELEQILQRTLGEDISLRLRLEENLPLVRADRGQMEQVLLNLTLNARDAMPLGGMLSVETAIATIGDDYLLRRPAIAIQQGRYVMLVVSDTGHGMDADIRRHAFEPFFTTKGVGKGTGLGLSTVYGIVKQSGGYVWVYSEPGMGTAFKIYLPLAPTRESVAPPQEPPAARGSETLLVVEDEANVRDMAARVLEAQGYRVLQAGDGAEALELIGRYDGQVDLVLTDVAMPVLNGRQLAARLAELRPGLPVLFTSGYTDDDIVRRGLLESGRPFLQKPFSPDALAQRVRALLDTARSASTEPLPGAPLPGAPHA
jgi:two-component system, cell cycle sensor histidine kinase and response regulator CckA